MSDVVIVGAGPAGAITAMLLARQGIEVLALEAAPRWRWRACGVFTSPAAVAALRALGITEAELGRIARPVPAMEVETQAGVRFRLTYGGSGSLADSAVGFDREGLDALLVARARAAGAEVRAGAPVIGLELEDRARQGLGKRRSTLRLSSGAEVTANLVVGADGRRSIVARAAGVARPGPIGRRLGLTFHAREPEDGGSASARIVVIDDGYVGLAPTPGARINVGIVLGPSWFGRLRAGPPARLVGSILARLPGSGAAGSSRPALLPALDHVAGAYPLGHAVSARSGDGWLLVGDAAGFLDPFTGEGLHRAIVSATLAAEAISGALGAGARRNAAAARRAHLASGALIDYDRAMRRGFREHDHVTRLVQAFLARPSLFEYAARRLAARTSVRETMGLVLGDLAPAARALDPRFLGALLRP
jgi:menaquinone-9 beta-reductase